MAIDRVQPLKLEDTSTGGEELDQFPTGLNPQEDHVECAGIVLDDSSNRDEAVRVWRVGNDLTFKDVTNPVAKTLADLLAGGSGSGITEAQHEALSTLVHDIDATSYEEYTYSGPLVTNCTVWTTSGKTQKIREEQYTYGVGSRVTKVITIQYDSVGVEKMRMVEDYAYSSSSRVLNVVKTKTGSP